MSLDQRLSRAAHQLADGLNPPDVDLDAVRARARSNRRRTTSLAVVATIAAVIAVIAVGASVLGSRNTSAPDPANPIPSSAPTAPSPSLDEKWPLERIRAEGSPVGEPDVTESGITTRVYVVCDGSRSECENDRPLRVPYQHVALEVTQDGRSALFGLGANEQYSVQEFDEDSVFVLDDPSNQWELNRSSRHRVLRADGSEVELRLLYDLAPAVPGPDLFIVDYGEDTFDGFEDVYRVNLRQRTLRPLDVPHLNPDGRLVQHLLPDGLDARHWGPNVDEFLWFADRNCTVQWATEDGTFEENAARRGTSGPECAAGWDPPTYIHDDMFPDGWLQPGRMALLERNDGRLFVHVSLDYGDTWQRIPVTDEDAVPVTLRQLG
jgi:hypothetical protein